MIEPDDIKKLYNVPQIELVYRSKVKACDRIIIIDNKTAYRVFMAAWDMNKIELVEQCKMLLLDRACRCIGMVDISTGGISATIVDLKIIFAAALKARASGIMLAHNHPSENLAPSAADLKITERIVAFAELLDMSFHDHLILSRNGYFSIDDEALYMKKRTGLQSVLKL
jgi:DNA repair protein RadC